MWNLPHCPQSCGISRSVGYPTKAETSCNKIFRNAGLRLKPEPGDTGGGGEGLAGGGDDFPAAGSRPKPEPGDTGIGFEVDEEYQSWAGSRSKPEPGDTGGGNEGLTGGGG